jgi:NADPH2:quinone reductase
VGSAVALLAGVLGNGARVGTVGHPEKIAAGLAAGWHTVAARGDGLADILHEALPDGADVILDPTGTAHLELDLDLAAPGARVVLFGNAGGGTPGPLPPLGRLIGGNVALIGFSMSRFRASRPEMVAEALRDGLELLASERIDLPVTVVESLDSVAATHDLLAAGRGQGKYVVRITS